MAMVENNITTTYIYFLPFMTLVVTKYFKCIHLELSIKSRCDVIFYHCHWADNLSFVDLTSRFVKSFENSCVKYEWVDVNC